ncbi:hypothetical protein [Thalassotalea euphylliae]|uniref:DUF4034 domain-containing protein n=1 Tax=Thalassotalea euphylliae TaxID=1655234 RepID=A0A3E0UC75_9GAMM|nr:hypothetical protein [Thalassotalea euphylliae]REL34177.1 hypothetical protein DXX92_01795 [Thalassotalea euphylliae]
MKCFIAFSAALLLCSCAAPQSTKLSETVNHENPSENTPEIPAIFSVPPKGTDLLISYDAYTAYRDKYQSATGAKSFAQAPSGAWGYVTKRDTQTIANSDALAICEQHNKKFSDAFPCKLVNVAGEWVNKGNEAETILASLPKFTPANPIDLKLLRSNVQADLNNKNYNLALAKRIWFHRHALSINEHYSAVRTSYGLSAWAELGDLYPPAKTLMRYATNHLKQTLLENPKNKFEEMLEYRSLNNALHRADNTYELFLWLDKNHPDVASANFHLFREALTERQAFQLYSKYTKPQIDYADLVSGYLHSINAIESKGLQAQEKIDKIRLFHNNRFIYDVSRLVAILAINNRTDEAELIVKKAQLELPSQEFTNSLIRALDGELPKAVY